MGIGLSSTETASLFNWLNRETITEARQIAEILRKRMCGLETLMYTCLYITNRCANNCSYCGFKRSNISIKRITLTSSEIADEAKKIKSMGVNHVIIIGGTLPEDLYREQILLSTKILLQIGLIPWIEFENLSKQTLNELHAIGATRFILFQETYNKERYEELHQDSRFKKDFDTRMKKIEEALKAGFEELGIGFLIGLSDDILTEMIGVLDHSRELMKAGAKVSISLPRLTATAGQQLEEPDSSLDFLIEKIAVILRLSLPQVSLALSARESATLRDNMFGVVNEIGSGGVTNPGGRTRYAKNYNNGDKQFFLPDSRSPMVIRQLLKEKGYNIT